MSSTIDAYAWMDQAPCKDMDLSEHDPFDPPTGGRYQSVVDEALAICARCPVVDECLDDALRMGDVWGVKGGKTGPERDAILHPKKIPAQRSPDKAKKTADERREEEKARNRRQYANESDEARERRRERTRERMARYYRDNKDKYNAYQRERYQRQKAEREAAELVDEVAETQEVDGPEMSVA